MKRSRLLKKAFLVGAELTRLIFHFGNGSFFRASLRRLRLPEQVAGHFRFPLSALGCFLLLSLFFVRPAWATDPFYQNYAALNYAIPGNPPPVINGTNYLTPAFDNENVFSVNFETYTPNPDFYEPWNMLYYTNNGTMIANSPITTNGFISSLGCGFRFDLQTTNVIPRMPADTFYNAGTIRSDSYLDGNNVFNFSGFQFFFQTSIGECLISATNIINPGTLDVGPEGFLQLTGQKVDLRHGTLNLENQNVSGGNLNLNAFGAAGFDTNGDWNPGVDLGPTAALSSLPYQIYLTNSTAYFQFEVSNGGTNITVRAVFVQNDNPNVPYNVYFNPVTPFPIIGRSTIEWLGSYVDPATGNSVTNYLYLNDYLDPVISPTNIFIGGFQSGVPDNYYFTNSPTQIPLGAPATAGFYAVFPSGSITNPYSYVNAQIIATSVATNASPSNPSGALTNLPGRIQITAGQELNLAATRIAGPNYMLLNATNQFDGNVGANITSPYSDIYLGVTNGSMTMSNLLAANIPAWNGLVQAWSARWTNTDSSGINWDYRVEIIHSDLLPTTAAQVQHLTLHCTNSLVLSDALNVLSSFNCDAQSLTLTTNGIGFGAESVDGELNLENDSILWHSSLPNLLWLTNSGAIRTGNLVQFGSATQTALSFVNNGLLSDNGSQIWATNFENSGVISNGVGNFTLQSLGVTLTNGALVSSAGIAITADSLVASNMTFQAGRGLTLQITNLLTDTITNLSVADAVANGVTNGNFWAVGSTTGSGGNGLILPLKPQTGDLRGTTITNYVPGPNQQVINIWAGEDRGISPSGFTNNMAIGRLVLDALGPNSSFSFSGVGASNALYVDDLELDDYATNTDTSGNLSALNLNTNLVIYYAQAIMNGVSVAARFNHQNHDRLRWVASYAGYFSATNLVYPDGSTNTVNAALAASTSADSDGDGVVNAHDPTPFFTADEVNFKLTLTNAPAPTALISWDSIPSATNTVLYSTNLLDPFTNVLTQFTSPAAVPPVGGWPLTNVVADPVNPATPRYYRVRVDPNSTQYFGPLY
jgi:hypothetical protein